jgi:hypothetical protein
MNTDNTWTSVKDAMPEDGQYIRGCNEKGGTWEEYFDKDEPLGRMVGWKPWPAPGEAS